MSTPQKDDKKEKAKAGPDDIERRALMAIHKRLKALVELLTPDYIKEQKEKNETLKQELAQVLQEIEQHIKQSKLPADDEMASEKLEALKFSFIDHCKTAKLDEALWKKYES